MCDRRLLAGALLAVAACGGGSDDAAEPPVVRALPVEAQACDRPQPRAGLATAVDDDLVITAGHVVDGDLRRLEVDGRPAVVAVHEPTLDLAVLAVDHGNDAVALDATSEIERATIITANEVLNDVPARAITLRVDDLDDGEVYERDALRLDADVTPGDSGGPVLDDERNLIGVVTLRRPTDEGSYATTGPRLIELVQRAREARDTNRRLEAAEPCV